MPENTEDKQSRYRHDNSDKSLDEMVEEVKTILRENEHSFMLNITCRVLRIGPFHPYNQARYSQPYK